MVWSPSTAFLKPPAGAVWEAEQDRNQWLYGMLVSQATALHAMPQYQYEINLPSCVICIFNIAKLIFSMALVTYHDFVWY